MVRSDKISHMELRVLFSEDPGFVMRTADKFLSSEPVLHNLILSIPVAIGSHCKEKKPSAWSCSPLWNIPRP
jgi:hypothetical protein